MGRKPKLSSEQIAKSIEMIDNNKISLRKRAIELGISHPQLRDSIIKYKKLLKENNLANTMKDKKIEQISKDMDRDLYKDHIENDQIHDQEIDQEIYENVVGSLRKQYQVPEKPKKPHKQQIKENTVYLSLDLLRGLYVLITGTSEQHKKSRKDLLLYFSNLFKDQVNVLR